MLTACSVVASAGPPGQAEEGSAVLAEQPSPPGQAHDLLELIDLATPAAQRARTAASDAVLRQVGVNFSTRQYTFHFTGGAPRREIAVVATPTTRSDAWPVTVTDLSPLAAGPSSELRLAALPVGPEAAAQGMRQAAARRFGGTVDVRVATAVIDDGRVVWYIFADVPQGSISGKLVSPAVGLQLLGPGPVRPPVVATGLPR